MDLFGWMRVNWKPSLACAAFGSIFTVMGMLVSPLEADRDKFGEIECTKLTVVGDKGFPLIELNSNHRRGSILVNHENENYGFVSIGVDYMIRSQGGFISVVGRNGEYAMLGISDYGGFASMSTGKTFNCVPLAEIGIRKLRNGQLEGTFNQSSTR